ncbi:YdcF family protein [Microbacterium sp. NPDC006705]|uniref:YdcF family protein n=1 Tax=Microbacterium sp. NPDC006705 TaxID=3364181 RepID=UPI00384A5244
MPGFFTLLFAALGILLAARDPRRMLPGVLLTLATSALVAEVVIFILGVGLVVATLTVPGNSVVSLVLIFSIPLLAAVGLGVALLANGVVMIQREGRSLANRLSLLAGVGVLAILALGIVAVTAGWFELAVILLLLAAPIGYVGMGFVAYLCWSAVYARLARRAPAPAAIVTLGSGLRRDGSVPPLLAQRVALGVETLQRSPGAMLVVSGGQGADEPRSEAAAMAEYAGELGAPANRLLVESASRTTEENLTLTRAILAERGITGPVLAVTSDYHAFRAATLLRTLGMPGHAIGARTARYYRPSALLREYLALLRDHLVLNAVALGILMLPLIAFVAISLITLFAD